MSWPLSLIVPAVGLTRRRTLRATVDLPQPLSPTRPSVSPAPIDRLTPSTARTWPTVRRSRPFFMGKCFLRPLTSRTGGLDIGRRALGVPAGGPMTRPLLLVGRKERPAALVGERATRREGAARWQVREGRHHAGDLGQALGLRRRRAAGEIEPRDRGQETLGIGMQRRREEGADLGLLYLPAALHDDDALRGFRHDTEI